MLRWISVGAAIFILVSAEVSYATVSDLRAIGVAERHYLQRESAEEVDSRQSRMAQEEHTDHETPTPPPTPLDVPPPGERNPYIALVAALAIVVVGVTGIFIYRMIREGL